MAGFVPPLTSLCAQLASEGFQRPYPEITLAQVRDASFRGGKSMLNTLLFKFSKRASSLGAELGVNLDGDRKCALVAQYFNAKLQSIGRSEDITEDLFNIPDFNEFVRIRLSKEGRLSPSRTFSFFLENQPLAGSQSRMSSFDRSGGRQDFGVQNIVPGIAHASSMYEGSAHSAHGSSGRPYGDTRVTPHMFNGGRIGTDPGPRCTGMVVGHSSSTSYKPVAPGMGIPRTSTSASEIVVHRNPEGGLSRDEGLGENEASTSAKSVERRKAFSWTKLLPCL